jgi:hypothetical protein
MKMKKMICSIAFMVILLVAGAAYSQSYRGIDINVRYGEYRIRVDLKPRVLIIQNDGEYIYMSYFANSAFEPRMQFLGQEIFQGGVKVVDTYNEND